jgi:hypothetical protein
MPIYVNNKDFITIENLHLTKPNGQWRGCVDNWTGGATASEGLIIRNCEMSWSFYNGIRIHYDHASASYEDIQIYDNIIHDIGWVDDGYGIIIQGNGGSTFTNLNIYRNDIDRTSEAGIRVFDADTVNVYQCVLDSCGFADDENSASISISQNCTEVDVYRNKMTDSGAESIWMTGVGGATDDVDIYYNICDGGGNFGIQATTAMDNVNIYNNVIRRHDGGLAIGVDGQCTNVTVKNNIFDALLNSTSENFHILNSSTWISDYNCWDEAGSQKFYYNGNDSTWAEWQANGRDLNGLYEDPIFKSTTDFRLKSSSPAIEAGVNVSLTRDYSNYPIPYSSKVDIGAYEYVPFRESLFGNAPPRFYGSIR